MSVEQSTFVVELLHRSRLRNYAKYLIEHREKVQYVPQVRPDHNQYLLYWLRIFDMESARQATLQPQGQNASVQAFLERPTFAAFAILNLLAIPCELCGKSQNIIRFPSEPLHSRLWITGSPCRPRSAPKCDGSWRQISLHTRHSSEHLLLNGISDLIKLFGNVAAFQVKFALNHLDINARIEAVDLHPFDNDAISDTLNQLEYKGTQPGSSRFIEASRQVERGFILDALIELFTPIVGVVPRFVPGSVEFVDFYHSKCKGRTNFLINVQIWRAQDRCPQYLPQLRSRILVTGLARIGANGENDESEDEESDSTGSESIGDIDMIRRFMIWLQRRKINIPLLQDRYKEALLYDLGNASERCELVFRIQLERDQEREAFQKQMAELKASRGGWKGKYCALDRYYKSEKRMRFEARLKKSTERRSGLRFCMTHDA